MTFSLRAIKRTRRDTPPRTVIYGPHKIGKSTFAASAPGAVFIPTEDGLDAIEAAAFPLCRTHADVLSAIGALYSDPHEYRTVVLDSGDWAERLIHAQVSIDHAGGNGIEAIGYGKGYTYAADLFAEMLAGLNALRIERGMAVIVLCHAEIRRYDDPLTDSYDRHQIKLHKGAAKLVQEWADVIGFAALDTMTRSTADGKSKDERTRALTTGRRVLHLAPSPAFDAGNRYGLPAQLPLDWAEYSAALDAARGSGTPQDTQSTTQTTEE